MISVNQVASEYDTLDEVFKTNIDDLVTKVNAVLSAWGKPVVVTSGFRSIADHTRIYAAKGISTPPMTSKHLTGQAVDVYDPDLSLTSWLKGKEPLNLWME